MSGLNSRTSTGLRQLENTNLVQPYVTGSMTALSSDSDMINFRNGAFDTIENANGPLEVNTVSSDLPLETVIENGSATTMLKWDPVTLKQNGDGSLTTVPLTVEQPLLQEDNHRVTLQHDQSLRVLPDTGQLSVDHSKVATVVPLVNHPESGISLEYDPTQLTLKDGKLSIVTQLSTIGQVATNDVEFPAPFTSMISQEESKTTIVLAVDHSLEVNTDGQLAVIVAAPIIRSSDGLDLAIGRGISVDDDGKLISNTDEVLKPLGALHTGGVLDMGMDELLELGYDALSDLTDEFPDTDITLIKLRTSDNFTQKNTLASFGGKALAIKSKGVNKIPFYGVFDGFNVSNRFKYNNTLSTLSVPRLKLQTSFNPDSNEAVTQNYVSQFIQGGEGTDLSPESNNCRQVNIRRDATLQIDSANNLGVNVSPLVNGSSVKIDSNGKISGGYIIQSANGVRLREGTNNDVQLALDVEGALEKVGFNRIKEILTAGAGLQRTDNAIGLDITSANSQVLIDNEAGRITGNISTKTGSGLSMNENIIDLQLEASQHIQVTGNKIATDLRPYTAGQNVTISNNSILVNLPEEVSYSGGPGISVSGRTISNTLSINAGMGITVMGSATTGYFISSQNLKQDRDDDDDKQQTDDTDETLRNENSEVVSTTSNVSNIFPVPLFPIPPIPPIPVIPIPIPRLPLPTLLGGLAALGGLFGVVFGYEKERQKKKNPDGTIQTDSEGNPRYDLDEGGNYIWDPIGGKQVAIVSDKTSRVTRLLFDTPPENIRVAYGQSGMNVDYAWQFENEISRPWTIDAIQELILPVDNRVTTNESSLLSNTSRISSVEGQLVAVQTNKQDLINVGKGLVKSSSTISINPYQSQTISAIEDVCFGLQCVLPSSVWFTDAEPSITAVSNEAWGNGSYTISSSHTNNVNRSHKAFQPGWGSSLWFTNVYTAAGVSSLATSTTAGGVAYKGEWIQIQLPAAKGIAALRMGYRIGGNIAGCPQTFAVVGSNDSATWNLLYHQATPVGWTEQNRDPKWFNMTTSTAYSYLRFVCLTNGGGYPYCGVRLEYFTPLDGVSLNKPLFVGNGITGNTATFSKTVTAEAAPTIGSHLVNGNLHGCYVCNHYKLGNHKHQSDIAYNTSDYC
ncbi:TPA_asm: fiber [Powellomyces chytrid fungus MELD virus 3]|nr:TPA_asm: fiber [Powellomyces chytrid fungus MELD virus 3]